jgi:serine/threonine-protein kinase
VTEQVPPATGDIGSGSQIASYRLGEQIGWGGMAVVYRALDIRLDRWVALKVLAPEIGRDDSFRQRFISESRAAAAVDHPHIIPVFEAGDAGGVLFIAMRYVGGGDVRTLFRRLGPLDAARVTSIVTQVASALDASHSIGLVHRDVKPANMLLGTVAGRGRPDHVYLADFGLSKQALSMVGLTQTGQFVGTLDYMAPEQIEARPVDGRADLYALACAAFEMLCGVVPFQRDQDLGQVFAQLSQPPPALTARRPDLPPAIDGVLARALAKSPGDRYESCLEFAASLRAACGLEWGAGGQLQPGPPGSGTELAAPGRTVGRASAQDLAAGQAWPSAPPLPQPRRTSGRHSPAPGGRPRWRARAIAVAAVILVIAAGAFAFSRHHGAAPSRPAASASLSGAARRRGPARPGSPAATVTAYIAAINGHHYGRAWRLGGRNGPSPYPAFVHGFGSTARDTLHILSVSGDVVTARLTARQTDGTVETYRGTYTVDKGVITRFDVRPAG